MEQILVYADSLSWGIIPNTRERLPFHQRWPGVMETWLLAADIPVRVIEDCLNGRRTVWEDPYKPGRNGLWGLAQRIESHSPLALVVLMLGSNDFQSMHPHNAWHSAQGIATLIGAIRQAPVEPGMPIPPVLLVAPPPIKAPSGSMAEKFQGAAEKSVGLAEAYRRVAEELVVDYFDAADVTQASRVDGIHLDQDQHQVLGEALGALCSRILRQTTPA